MFSPNAPLIYQSPKCFVTYGSMGHVDRNQVPRRSKPWSSIMTHKFLHTVDLIFPSEAYEAIYPQIAHDHQPPMYNKVIMALGDVLEREFLCHIKQGDILMISEGKDDVDNTFTLKNGILDMHLDKQTYEWTGLVGNPYGPKGGRGLQPRWIVSYDLRSPSMCHGKKGFDRLVYASKTVFPQPRSWLACNVAPMTSKDDPWSKYSPISIACNLDGLQHLETTIIPMEIAPETLAQGDRASLEIAATELYEWLSLLRLGSPRARVGDDVDPYLARYDAPEGTSGKGRVSRLRWSGFISPQWLRDTFARVLSACPQQTWFTLTATEFSRSAKGGSAELSILKPGNSVNEYLMWEIRRE